MTDTVSVPPHDRQLPETARTRHRRLREQGSLDRDVLDAILGAGFVCHLGVTVDGNLLVVPTVYGSDGTTLYFHGSVASRSLVASPKRPSVSPSPMSTASSWRVRSSSTASTTAVPWSSASPA